MKIILKRLAIGWAVGVGFSAYIYCLMLMDGYDKTRASFCAVNYNFQYVLLLAQFPVCKLFERVK